MGYIYISYYEEGI